MMFYRDKSFRKRGSQQLERETAGGVAEANAVGRFPRLDFDLICRGRIEPRDRPWS